MSLPGSILLVTDHPDHRLIAALTDAGAFPVIESTAAEAATAIARVEPAAVLFADPDMALNQGAADALMDAIDGTPAPFMPVLARVNACGATVLDVLPIHASAPAEQIVARLNWALRVRTLHATVLRRIETSRHEDAEIPQLPASDPLDDATMLVAGRGGTYPALTTAVGEQVALIGALGVETAARYLNNRDVDGVLIGEGFGRSTVEAFLTALVEDSRFRDLPVGVISDIPAALDRKRLCGLEPVSGAPHDIVAHLLPLVRVHAFAARLRRHITTLDAGGAIDPQTGLLTATAFQRELPRAISDAHERSLPMSMARFSFPDDLSRRGATDAARLTSRLIRAVDFACQIEDGSIVVVFAESALRHAHVIARRIASVIRHTMLDHEHADGTRSRVEAAVTLASLKANDTAQSLLARVSTVATIAAE